MTNLVVIVADTFRRDHLSGICPNAQMRTPFLERFAEKCVTFDQFYAGSFPTLPHRTDCFTGKYVCMEKGWAPLDENVPTLAGLLTDRGYRTQLITNCPHLMGKNHYYQRGFEFAHWVRGQEADWHFSMGDAAQPTALLPDVKTRHTFPFEGWNLGNMTKWHHNRWQWEEDYQPAETAREASKWLEWNYKDKPFFLWVDFFDPHEPWDAPEYLVDRYADPSYDGVPMIHPNYGPADVYTEAELKNMQAHYKAECHLVDKWVGHVIQKIEDLGLMDNTMIVFTTDHGIYVGEHNRTGKSNIYDGDNRHWPVFEELASIPFTVYHPKAEGGRHVSGFAQPVDMTRTLLEVGGARAPDDLHGRTLLPVLLGEADRAPRDFAVCCEKTNNPTLFTDQWMYQARAIGEYKSENLRPALFDRRNDPRAEHNLAGDKGDVVKDLHARLTEFFRSNGATPETMACYEK